MNLNFKKIDLKNPKIQIMMIIILIICAVLYFGYNNISKKTEEIVQLQDKLKAKQKELNGIRLMRRELARMHESIQMDKETLDSLRSIFPDQKEIPKLIREITKVASKSGIFTSKFNPMPDVEREHYIENRYSMTVVGGYHQLASFFSYLANFELIINLSRLTIKSNPGIKSSIENSEENGFAIQSVVATFTMTTFSSRK